MLLQLVGIFLFGTLCASSEKITLNGEDDWAPYSYATSKYDTVQGLAPLIIRAAFKTQGVEVDFRPVPYARCIGEVENGLAIGCFNTLINQDTKDKFIFHKTPLFYASMVAYGPIQSPEKSLQIKDFEGKVVGVTSTYTYPSKFVENKKIIREESPTEKSQLEKLAMGRIQYAILWGLTGEYLINKSPRLKLKIKPIDVISKDPVYINFSKKHKDGSRYASVFEKGMQAIIANGTYKKIEDKFREEHHKFKKWLPHNS